MIWGGPFRGGLASVAPLLEHPRYEVFPAGSVADAVTQWVPPGMTVTEVRGHGKQKGHTAIYRGKEYDVSLLPKMEIEIVVPDNLVDDAVAAIIQAARTGEIGDGRVFVIPVEQSYRIRTGERSDL